VQISNHLKLDASRSNIARTTHTHSGRRKRRNPSNCLDTELMIVGKMMTNEALVRNAENFTITYSWVLKVGNSSAKTNHLYFFLKKLPNSLMNHRFSDKIRIEANLVKF